METKKDLSVRQDYPPLNGKSGNEQVQTSATGADAPPLLGPNQNAKRTKDKGKGPRKGVP